MAEPPSPGPLTLLTLLSKKQRTMQRPPLTQRVLALPVIQGADKAKGLQLKEGNPYWGKYTTLKIGEACKQK